MNEYIKSKLANTVKLMFLALCLALVVTGHQTAGLMSLGRMFLGLAGILILLYQYNRSQTGPNT